MKERSQLKKLIQALVVGVCFYCSLSSSELMAQANQEEILIHVMGVKPFGFIDVNDQTTKGIHYDIIGELARRTNLKIKRILLPYPRIWSGLQTGTHDGGIAWRSSDRDGFVVYVHFVFSDHISAFVLKGRKKLAKYEDLYTVGSVGFMRGLSISERFNQDDNILKYQIRTMEQSVLMLDNGRIDAVVGSIYSYLYLSNQIKLRHEIDFPGIRMGDREQWFQMSKKSKMLKYVPRLKKALSAMVREKYPERIYEKYLGPSFSKIRY